MLKPWILVLFANFVLVTPATLVPRINNANGFQLEPGNNQYIISIRPPDKKSLREEIVKEIAPGILEVKGVLIQQFEKGKLVVIYEAGPNGYVAKYKFAETKTDKGGPIYVVELSPAFLKSSAG
ncbi:GH20763 [Drosophila grimshawi]|uniref:GH20763 n=1 Tax=Drosophila grimshawi TaxID=7222 RepID=B4J6C5_DROGR|nr:GH20763 [Drosophila grimshawi]